MAYLRRGLAADRLPKILEPTLETLFHRASASEANSVVLVEAVRAQVLMSLDERDLNELSDVRRRSNYQGVDISSRDQCSRLDPYGLGLVIIWVASHRCS